MAIFHLIDLKSPIDSKITKGERDLVNFFNNCLDDSYEIFFHPSMLGLTVDIAVVRKNHGILLIKVVNTDMDIAEIYKIGSDNESVWRIVGEDLDSKFIIDSPIKQLHSCKDACCYLYVHSLALKVAIQSKAFSIIDCAVYFPSCDTTKISRIVQNIEKNQYLRILGKDALVPNKFRVAIRNNYFSGQTQSIFFTDDIYEDFTKLITPSIHYQSTFKSSIVYTPKQKELIKSSANRQTKIRGVAGSGKTRVLAELAVNSHLRTNSAVLILTFNITLRNYIKNMLDSSHEKFLWDDFVILHYHAFQRHNYNYKFQTILVDEIQDYKKEWVDHIKSFLADNGEIVFFGDEKQNIYRRELVDDNDKKRPYTGVRGRWNELKTTFRLKNKIAFLANEFQQAFFSNSYDYEKLEIQEQDLFAEAYIAYYYLEEFDLNEILKIYSDFIEEHNYNHRDVCFLGNIIETLRKIRYRLEQNGFETCSTFESEQEYKKLEELKNRYKSKETFETELSKLRRVKKFHFTLRTDCIKLSTIHSFKGWESPTVFLFIEEPPNMLIQKDDNDTSLLSEELLYTGITRARQKLVIINIGVEKYDNFFKKSETIN